MSQKDTSISRQIETRQSGTQLSVPRQMSNIQANLQVTTRPAEGEDDRSDWERPDGHSTDPRWKPEEGGLPERWLPSAATATSAAWPSPTAGTGTITPPHAEPLSPYIRSRLELAERAIVEALEELRRIKEGRP
jgi:hypothetical protein